VNRHPSSLGASYRYVRKLTYERVGILRHKLVVRDPELRRPPARPIFVVGCPRSGTTLLFQLLRCHENVRALPGEGHVLWNAYQHPRLKGWTSDRATGADIRPGEAGYLYAAINRLAGGFRFLDKTPKNVLKIPYLAALFPDASFVLIKRDGPGTVSSLIDGWKARRGISYRLPIPLHLADLPRTRLWSFVLPQGWRQVVGTSIAEVAALQYVDSWETALTDVRALPAGSWTVVSYEDLVADPVRESRRLLEVLELPASDQVEAFARRLPHNPVAAITPPAPGKWRRNAEDILRIYPSIAPTVARLGYETGVTLP